MYFQRYLTIKPALVVCESRCVLLRHWQTTGTTAARASSGLSAANLYAEPFELFKVLLHSTGNLSRSATAIHRFRYFCPSTRTMSA